MYDPRSLIGRRLKSPECIAVLKEFALQIIYDIDLNAERTDDVYWIRDFAHGCCWAADAGQQITVGWVHLRAADGYQAFPWPLAGIAWDAGGLAGWGEPAKTDRYRGMSTARYDRAEMSTYADWDSAGPLKLTFMLPREEAE